MNAEVSDQKEREPIEVSLLRKRSDGTFFNINMGWVSDVSLATICSPYVLATLNTLHDSAQWEVVSLVESPF